jgi:hypothetical protein
MIELWKSLSDDQIALLGCAAALIVTGTMMSLSYYIGRARIAAAGQKSGEPVILEAQAGCLQPASSTAVADRRDAA